MPPRDSMALSTRNTAIPAWYTKLRPRQQQVPRNPTDSVLRDQVQYKPKDHRPGMRALHADMEGAY